jgi:hypothetical protein
VDDPASADQFHIGGGRTIDANSSKMPVLEANVAGCTVQQHPADELGTGMKIHGEGPNGKDFCMGSEAAAADASAVLDSVKVQ